MKDYDTITIIQELKKAGSVIPQKQFNNILFDSLAKGENFRQIANNVCISKGVIMSGIARGLSDVEIHVEDKNIINVAWQDIVAALNRRGLLEADEAKNLITEIRW